MNSATETLNEITAEQDRFLIHLQRIVFVIIILYFFVFLFFDAPLSALTLGIGIFVLAPVTYKLQQKSRKTAAKLLLLSSCNFYVYGASYGLQHELNFEYFFLPAMMLTLLIFNPKERFNIVFGFVVPLIVWGFLTWGPPPHLFANWVPTDIPKQEFRNFNFFTAYAIAGVFLNLYLKSLARLQDYSLKTANLSRDHLRNALEIARASESSLAEAQKLAKIGNWSVNQKTNRAVWSSQMFGIFPRTQEQGVPNIDEYRACLHPDDRDAWQSSTKRCLAQGESYVNQYRILHSDKVVWVEIRGQAMIENGVIIGLQGTCQDISEQKMVQESLKEVNAWREAVMDASPFAILATNFEGVTTVCNHAAERLLEATKECILSKGVTSFFDPSQFSFSPTTDGSFDIKECTIVNATDKKIPIRLCISYIFDTNCTHTGYLYIMEDLTEQKRLLQTIEAQDAQILLSAKMSALGEMASEIAHEINNPLSIIHAKASMLRRLVDGGQPILDQRKLVQIGDGLSKIEITAARIAKIICGLKTFSRNSDQDDMQNVAISRVIEDTLELCRERFRINNIDLKVDIIADGDVKCRSVQISQVLMNLLNNAFDAAEQLTEKWVHVHTEVSGARLLLSVTDSGNGIPPAIAEKMMKPFFTTKEIGKGTGLGLGISIGIIQAHGGTLSYDAAAKNTRFVIELPRHC